MNELLHYVAHDFDTTRHFLAAQAQPIVWWGNIVAGVVVFVVVDVCWNLFAKKWVKKAIAEIHREELARHHRDVVKPEADARHAELFEQAAKHHKAHLDAIRKAKP
jgi:hypothetical protein